MKVIEDMTRSERLTELLYLGITSPTSAKYQKVLDMLSFYTAGLSEPEIERCKAAASFRANSVRGDKDNDAELMH